MCSSDLRMRIIPPEIFPEELYEQEVDFTFNSPLNEAEGQKTVASYMTAMQVIASGAQVDSTVSSIMDIRKATEDAVRGTGAEADWLLTGDEKKSKDAEAAQTKAMQDAAALAQQGAGVVADLSNAAATAQQSGLT